MSINKSLNTESFITYIEKLKQDKEKFMLSRSLKDLPKPENEYSFEIPEIEETHPEKITLYLDSEVIKRNLPRPILFNTKFL